jgi:hypothetical protein
MVRMFWLLLGVYGFVTTLHGQWQELDAALTEQVNSGWLSGQERLRILDHLDRTGAPIGLEEAWAIQGLTHAAAQALMQNVEWQHLVDRAQRQVTGRGLAAEGRFARAIGVHSVRLRNPGKWGLRWDHGAAAVTGYVQASVGRGGQWRALLGGHRLGWGNRSDVHPLWIKCRREWPEGVAAEVHWRTAQTSRPDARASQRLEFRGH